MKFRPGGRTIYRETKALREELFLIETKERQAPGESPTGAQDAGKHRLQAWKSTFWQFLRYCLVGGANTIIDLLVLNVLLWRIPTHNAQTLVLYNSFAYTCGALSSFFLNKYWTFRRRQRATLREVVRFALSLLLEVIYSGALIWLAGKALQPFIGNPTLWGNASKLIAVVIGTVISYSFMRFWIFAGGPHNPQDRQAKRKDARQDNHSRSNR
jgi:putative flippase GtrA